MRATAVRQGAQAAVESVRVAAYTVPTDEPESDGTAEWDSTTIVVVELRAGGKSGIGYTYAPAAAGKLVEEKLAEVVTGRDAFAIGETWAAMGSAGERWRMSRSRWLVVWGWPPWGSGSDGGSRADEIR